MHVNDKVMCQMSPKSVYHMEKQYKLELQKKKDVSKEKNLDVKTL